jgi:hypothetical protein
MPDPFFSSPIGHAAAPLRQGGLQRHPHLVGYKTVTSQPHQPLQFRPRLICFFLDPAQQRAVVSDLTGHHRLARSPCSWAPKTGEPSSRPYARKPSPSQIRAGLVKLPRALVRDSSLTLEMKLRPDERNHTSLIPDARLLRMRSWGRKIPRSKRAGPVWVVSSPSSIQRLVFLFHYTTPLNHVELPADGCSSGVWLCACVRACSIPRYSHRKSCRGIPPSAETLDSGTIRNTLETCDNSWRHVAHQLGLSSCRMLFICM